MSRNKGNAGTGPNAGSRGPSLWRNRDFILLQGGQLVSFVGSQQQGIALPLLILALTGSPVQAGIVLALNTVAFLVMSLLAGALVDRWDRKRVMIWCDLGRMLAAGSIPLALWAGRLTLAQIYLVAVVSGILSTFFDVANAASLPNVVGVEELPAALAQVGTAYGIVRLFGSLAGGLLYSIGRAIPFLANSLSFAVSVVSLRFIRARFQQERQTVRRSLRTEIGEGLVWLWHQPLLRFLTFVDGADSLRYAGGYLVIIVLARQLGANAAGIGAIFSAAGLGALLGTVVARHTHRRIRFGRIAIGMVWIEAALFPLYAVAPNVFVMALIAAGESFVDPIYTIALSSYRISITPDDLRGRVTSSVQMVTGGALPLGSILAGVLLQGIGPKPTALLFGAWLILLALITSANARVRNATILDTGTVAGAAPGST